MLRNYTIDQTIEKLDFDVVELRFIVHHFAEFLSASTSGSAERTFTGADLELLGRIYKLLHEDGNDPGNVCLQLRKEALARPVRSVQPHSIAFSSGRPGTGKSAFIYNLAAALAVQGHRCTIFDGAFGDGGVARLLFNGFQQPDWHHVLPSGVQMVTGEKYLESMEGAVADVANAMEQKLADINAASDFILIDTGSGRSDNALRYAMVSDEILLVTTPDVGANADCFSAIRMLKDIDPDLRVSLVIDRAQNSGSAHEVLSRINGAARKLCMAEIPGVGWISEDEGLRKCMSNGETVVEMLPTSISARCISRIADQLATRAADRSPGQTGGMTAFMQALRNAVTRGTQSRGSW